MTTRMNVVVRGRANRLALLLLTVIFLGWGVPVLATDTLSKQVNSGPRWWLQVMAPDDRLLVNIPMPDAAGWCLAWNHSVEGFTVHDCYRNQAGQMLLERSHLPDFAAGLDHIPGRGRQISDGQGGYWIEDINEPVPGSRYRLRVGSNKVNHRLVSHGQPTLRQLTELKGVANAGCPLLVPGMTLAQSEVSPSNRNTAAVISLSELAAGRGVIIQLVDNALCGRIKSSAF
ncbi:DUF1850 domain-containing protein [Halomonas halocynthiae]|uniref:DUF1850 domain-containing protein n=1 Tax=Halomonas halocynthiae TaxID=176290 RepID=UPI0004284428|nr:DUF1850 domain-containing protein [Halomonas halocynthiae]